MKIGHQAPPPYRSNTFRSVELPRDLGYCSSHNFVFSYEEETEKLYSGKPCIYTDSRYRIGSRDVYNYRRKGSLPQRTLKALFRLVESISNIPVGTIIKFGSDWYIPNKKVDFSYHYKVKTSKLLDIKYQVNDEEYLQDISDSPLAIRLAEKGFLISTNFDRRYVEDSDTYETYTTDIKYHTAYGKGKVVFFADVDVDNLSHRGEHYIMWDKINCFDKYSKCNTIDKDLGVDYIVGLLTTPNDLISDEQLNWTQANR